MRMSLIAAFLSAAIAAAPAQAQTADDARAFFDQVATSGATVIYQTFSTGEVFTAHPLIPARSITTGCTTQITGQTNGEDANAAIDWSHVIDVHHYANDPNRSGLFIVGGMNFNGVMAPAMLLDTNAISMDPRIAKAMQVLIKACEPPTHGF